MKRVTNACIGGRNFTLNDDAYNRLDAYLRHFRDKLTVPEAQKGEVMDEIEGRLSELFYQEVGDTSRVVTLEMVEKVVSILGMPDGSAETGYTYTSAFPEDKVPKKLYRDMENKGVALSRERILNKVWNYDYYGDPRTIDTHVKKLRSKLGKKSDCIVTIRGYGYKFVEPESGKQE